MRNIDKIKHLKVIFKESKMVSYGRRLAAFLLSIVGVISYLLVKMFQLSMQWKILSIVFVVFGLCWLLVESLFFRKTSVLVKRESYIVREEREELE